MNEPVTSARQRPLPDPASARDWLATMQLIRRFEERAGEMHAAHQIGGFLHLAIGEEATIVGAVRALEDRDWLLSTYRTHAHALARGTEPARVMAELFGRVGGICAGRGGAMHVADPERRFLGGHGFGSGHLPVAAGVGLASAHQGRAEVTMCVLGDAATADGTFGASLQLTAGWNLPVVYVVINNQFGVEPGAGAPGRTSDLLRRSEGYGAKGLTCDGMDVLETHAVCSEAVRIARTEQRPVVVEALNSRARGESMADPQPYKTKNKAASAEWKQRDPITTFGDRLIEVGLLESSERARIQMQANAVVEQAVSIAGRSSAPPPSALYDHVYAPLDEPLGWYGVDQRGTGRQAETDAHPREDHR